MHIYIYILICIMYIDYNIKRNYLALYRASTDADSNGLSLQNSNL